MTLTDPPHRPVAEEAYVQTAEWVAGALGVDPARGLGLAEAQDRLARFGPNELETDQPPPGWQRFMAQFRDGLVTLLLGAAVVSVALWLYERDMPLPYEAFAILAIVFLNAVLGFVQEARAERAVAALQAMSAARARVLREGEAREVPAREVVPGDVLLVEEGDAISADARLVQAVSLRTLEASLTGESLTVNKATAPWTVRLPWATAVTFSSPAQWSAQDADGRW